MTSRHFCGDTFHVMEKYLHKVMQKSQLDKCVYLFTILPFKSHLIDKHRIRALLTEIVQKN